MPRNSSVRPAIVPRRVPPAVVTTSPVRGLSAPPEPHSQQPQGRLRPGHSARWPPRRAGRSFAYCRTWPRLFSRFRLAGRRARVPTERNPRRCRSSAPTGSPGAGAGPRRRLARRPASGSPAESQHKKLRPSRRPLQSASAIGHRGPERLNQRTTKMVIAITRSQIFQAEKCSAGEWAGTIEERRDLKPAEDPRSGRSGLSVLSPGLPAGRVNDLTAVSLSLLIRDGSIRTDRRKRREGRVPAAVSPLLGLR